jgi:hypothetical protein
MFYVLNMHLSRFLKMQMDENKCLELVQVDGRTLIKFFVLQVDGTLKCINYFQLLHIKIHNLLNFKAKSKF